MNESQLSLQRYIDRLDGLYGSLIASGEEIVDVLNDLGEKVPAGVFGEARNKSKDIGHAAAFVKAQRDKLVIEQWERRDKGATLGR